VRWREQPHFFNSSPTDRHYVIERATGLLQFGDSRNGLIPPAGARILANYGIGGGLYGNVGAGAITELHSSVAYLKEFKNPVAATGGAATETLKAVGSRGPHRIRNLDRAISADDFEWLAHEASPAVARARCLPISGPEGSGQLGWVTLIVLPFDAEAMPQPTRELRRRVKDYIGLRAPATISNRIRVEGPAYVPVGIVAEIIPKSPDEAAQVEARALDRLNKFLHPLSGGPDGEGWGFGQPVYLSQIAMLIENTQGVDYASQIGLRVGGQVFDESVPIDSNALVASGDHELKLTMGEA
jgi:predicted phage baseplate assembly protein